MIIIVVFGLLGLVVGPWLGVAVDRTVEREGPATEHRCVHCRTGQGIASIVPVMSWFRPCRSGNGGGCGLNTGIRYVGVDVVTAATFGLLGWRFGLHWMLLPYLGLAAVLIVLSAIDLETHLLPNIIMWPAIGIGLFIIIVGGGFSGDNAGINAALLGGAVFGGFIGAAHLVYEPGMGRGDVKLALLCGLFLGWLMPSLLDSVTVVLNTLIIALVGGGVIGIIANLVRRRSLRAEIAFGPALAIAAQAMIIAVS